MADLRKHAFITHRGLEYRECGEWKQEKLDFYSMSADAFFARIWSENRAVWILCEECAGDVREMIDFSAAAHFHVVRNRMRDVAELGADENLDHIEASERVSFKPYNVSERTKDCLLFFPGKCEQWEMSEEDEPEVIERALSLLQERLGRSLVYPPGRLSTYLMEKCREKAKEAYDYKRPPSTFAPWLALKTDGIDPLDDWKRLRPLLPSEKRETYIHAFDKNNMYMHAIGAPLGVGEYRYYKHNRLLDYDRPGVWQVKTKDKVIDGIGGLFNPPGLKGSEPFYKFVTTPQFKLLRDLDLICEIEGAWLADDSCKLFASYYSQIKKALDLCADGAPVSKMARRFVKAIYSRGVGYLRAEFARESGEWFYRPDWWATIVSEAGARLFRDVLDVRRNCGALPFCVYVDCLYYVSNERDPQKAFPNTFFNERLSGRYKHKGTCLMTSDLAEAYENNIAPGTFGGMFKRAAREFGGEA